jgi:hypothetical protein
VNVTAVEPKGDKAALLVMENNVRVWTPDIEKAKPLIGKPIPGDWTQREGDYGPQALPPKDKKGAPAPAYRNTKEGQATEQTAMNRRTALMQAVEYAGLYTDPGPLEWRGFADEMYRWLTSSEGVGVDPDRVGEGARSVPTTIPSVDPPVPSSSVEASPGGDGASFHEHQWIPSPKLSKYDICTVPGCYDVRKKEPV